MTNAMTIITDEKEMAQALNFGKYTVLTYDISGEELTYGAVNHKTSRGTIKKTGKLCSGYQEENDGVLYLLSLGTMLSSHTDVHGWIRHASNANAHTFKLGEEVAVLYYMKATNTAFVRLVKVDKIHSGSSDILIFADI